MVRRILVFLILAIAVVAYAAWFRSGFVGMTP
jgi:hypothetical protein